MTFIRFLFVLYWFAPFLKFGPLPSGNTRCVAVVTILLENLETELNLELNLEDLGLV